MRMKCCLLTQAAGVSRESATLDLTQLGYAPRMQNALFSAPPFIYFLQCPPLLCLTPSLPCSTSVLSEKARKVVPPQKKQMR